MKRLTVFLLISAILTLSLLSCGQNEAEAAAAALLDRCIACESDAVAAVMGYEILSLTDIERYTLTRMQYKIVGSAQFDSRRWDVTVDTNLFDIMTLLNDAAILTYTDKNGDFDSNLWVLQQLNTNQALRANFRAVIPMISTDSGWQIDTDRIGNDLRDAISGGAYSWYAVYMETFGGTDTESAEPS